MNITYKIDKIKKNNWLNIAFDIGKDDLHFYSEMGNGTITCLADSFANKTDIILVKLEDLSGQFKGHRKLSKKGRPRLRLILGKSIFHLIKKDRILGAYYHSLKERHAMNGTKAMSVVSRKLVDVLFALSKPGSVFDQKRLFVCKGQYKKAA